MSPSKKCTRKRCPVLMERDPLLKYHDFYVIIFLKRRIDQMKPDIETLRKKYIENPPEGIITKTAFRDKAMHTM